MEIQNQKQLIESMQTNLTLAQLTKNNDYQVFKRKLFDKIHAKKGHYWLVIHVKIPNNPTKKPIKLGILLTVGFTTDEEYLISLDLREKIKEIYKI